MIKTTLLAFTLSAICIAGSAQDRVLFLDLTPTNEGVFMHDSIPFTGTSYAVTENGILQYEKVCKEGKIYLERNYYAYPTDSVPKLKFESEMMNGKRHGVRKGWYHSGALKFESNYSKGWNDGKSTNWYENGKLEKEVYFKKGVKVETYKNWNKGGVLVKERIYEQVTPTTSKLIRRKKYDPNSGEMISDECLNHEGEIIDCTD
jgi:antitoxin component YwqK of YwqJK toxin-antitoxin module